MFAVQANGHAITTIEGIGTMEHLHPIQQAFWEAHGAQCGFCTPGMILSVMPFLEENKHPTDDEIREVVDGNLCRCTGYQHIVNAVKLAAVKLAEQQTQEAR
jgi:carbon-monoxide dehydrogenase small subunit